MMLLSFLAIFMHKTGLIFLMIVVFSTMMRYLTSNLSHLKKAVINFFIGASLLYGAYISLNLFGYILSDESSRIIGGDFRWAFAFISLIYITLSIFYKNILNNSFNLSLYYFSFISLSFLISGLNWQYERMGMMMIIPYILSFGVILNRPSYKIYLFLTFLGLLWVTILMGMYASLK